MIGFGRDSGERLHLSQCIREATGWVGRPNSGTADRGTSKSDEPRHRYQLDQVLSLRKDWFTDSSSKLP